MTQQNVEVSDANPGLNMAISVSVSDASSLYTPSSWPSSSGNSKIRAGVSDSFNVKNEEMTRGARHCLIPLSSSEGTVSTAMTHNPQPPDEAETAWRSFILDVMKIIHELDMGKPLLGLAIPMGVALAVSARSLVQTILMHAVAISLSFAVAPICISPLVHKIYPRVSALMLLFGYALMLLSFYALLASHLPLYLLWVPLLCWIASLIVPFSMFAWAYFPTDKNKHRESKTSI